MFRWFSTLIVLSMGCAPSLDKEWTWNDEALESDTSEEQEPEEGVFSKVIDASDPEVWIYLDIEEDEIIAVEEPLEAENWDIGLQRFNIKLNSGVHGPSNVEAALVAGESYVPYDEAPFEGYEQDLADANDDEIPEYVLADWYDYDSSTHILTPKDQFYVLKSRNQQYYKFRIVDYYDEAGTSGFMTIDWEEIDAPSDPTPANPDIDKTIDATDSATWIYFDLESGTTVSPETPTDSSDWDLAFQRYTIAVNGGVSGTGNMEVLPIFDVYNDFENITEIPDGDWITDEEDANEDTIPEYAFKDWFNYDSSTHVLTPADTVYLVRTVEENIFRVRIIEYYSAQGDSGYMSIEFDQL